MSREFIYIQLTGPTASFRLPTAISGTQLALEAPPYSSILGMLSYATGREITPTDTRIGYIYQYSGKGMDLETIHRWERRSTGSYKYAFETNIRQREIHYDIKLDIIVDNLDLIDELVHPTRQLTFGRSQDLATVEQITVVDAENIQSGHVRGTLLPIEVGEDIPADGMFYNLPEYFAHTEGKIRRARNMRSFLALTQRLSEIHHDNLWQVNINESEDKTFYLHSWSQN